MKKTIDYLLGITGVCVALALGGCSKSSSSLPAIGGYNSSGDIAPTNLIAYWPMDGSVTESKQSLAGTNSGGTFATGIKGQGWQGNASSYISYTAAGTALPAIQSFTVSLWFSLPAAVTANTEGIFFMYDSAKTNTARDLFEVEIESHKVNSSDSIRLHAGFNDTGAPIWQDFQPEGYFTHAINKWVHLVYTYDGSSSTYILYQNGTPAGALTAFTSGAYSTPDLMYTDGSMSAPLGNILFKKGVRGIVIGAWPQELTIPNSSFTGTPDSWAKNFQGIVDEIRVYNKALSASDIGSLYQLELAGR